MSRLKGHHSVDVIQFDAASHAGFAMPCIAVVLTESPMDAQDSPESISQNPSQEGNGSRVDTS